MLCVKNGIIHDAIHREAFKGDILVEDGKIKEIGENLETGGDIEIVDAKGFMCIRALLKPTGISDLTATALAMRGWTITR